MLFDRSEQNEVFLAELAYPFLFIPNEQVVPGETNYLRCPMRTCSNCL
jgi:hypothetical protein